MTTFGRSYEQDELAGGIGLMHELQVSGEIETVALVDGSSGRFTGSIEGPYEGYRVGNPVEQRGVIEVANGSIGLILRHEIPMTRRRGENPYKVGEDPFKNPPPGSPLEWLQEKGIIPPGVFPPGGGAGPASGPRPGGPPAGGAPGGPPGGGARPGFAPPPFTEVRKVKLYIDPETSTGIYAGATGEIEVDAPDHKEFGYMVVETQHGNLLLNFGEHGEGGKLVGDMWVDGEKSTGIYNKARGELKFWLDVFIQGLAKGPYSGTIWLEHEPPTT
jgi:hypothetical protein